MTLVSVSPQDDSVPFARVRVSVSNQLGTVNLIPHDTCSRTTFITKYATWTGHYRAPDGFPSTVRASITHNRPTDKRFGMQIAYET